MDDYQVEVESKRRDHLEQGMREWLDQVKKPALKNSSYQRLYSTCEKWIWPELGQSVTEYLRASDIQQLISKMSDAGMSTSSQKKVRDALGDYLSFYIATNDLHINNAARFVTVQQQPARTESDWYLSDDQCVAFLDACYKREDPRAECLRFILLTGLRAGEALALTSEDYDWDTGVLSVSKTIALKREINAITGEREKKSIYISTRPKTRSGTRFVPLNAESRKIMESTIKSYGGGGPGVRIFPFSVIQLDKYIRGIYKEIGWTGKRGCHVLRHSYVAAMLRCSAGDPSITLATISALVGHRSLSITTDVYGHLSDQVRLAGRMTVPRFNPTPGGGSVGNTDTIDDVIVDGDIWDI